MAGYLVDGNRIGGSKLCKFADRNKTGRYVHAGDNPFSSATEMLAKDDKQEPSCQKEKAISPNFG